MKNIITFEWSLTMIKPRRGCNLPIIVTGMCGWKVEPHLLPYSYNGQTEKNIPSHIIWSKIITNSNNFASEPIQQNNQLVAERSWTLWKIALHSLLLSFICQQTSFSPACPSCLPPTFVRLFSVPLPDLSSALPLSSAPFPLVSPPFYVLF